MVKGHAVTASGSRATTSAGGQTGVTAAGAGRPDDAAVKSVQPVESVPSATASVTASAAAWASAPAMTPSQLVAAAREVAERAHAAQVDKAGVPYITHPARVAQRVQAHGPHAVAAAWLHDVVEDTAITPEQLRAQGFPREVVDAVVALTRLSGDVGEDYYRRVAANPLAVLVKLADLDDNTDPVRVAALDAATQQRLRRKYAHARQVLTTLASSASPADVAGVADVADPDSSAGSDSYVDGPGAAAAGV